MAPQAAPTTDAGSARPSTAEDVRTPTDTLRRRGPTLDRPIQYRISDTPNRKNRKRQNFYNLVLAIRYAPFNGIQKTARRTGH